MYPVIGRGWPETLSIRFISPPSIRLNGNAHIPLLRLFLFSFSLQTFDVDKNKKPSNSGEGKKKKGKTSFEAALNKNVRFQFSPRPAAHSSRRKLRFQPHQAFFFFPSFFLFFFPIDERRLKTFKTNERPFPLSQSTPHASGTRDDFPCTLTLVASRDCFAFRVEKRNIVERNKYVRSIRDRISKFLGI